MTDAYGGSLNVTVRDRGVERLRQPSVIVEFFEPNRISVIISQRFQFDLYLPRSCLKTKLDNGERPLNKKTLGPWTLFCYRTLLDGDAGYLLHRA